MPLYDVPNLAQNFQVRTWTVAKDRWYALLTRVCANYETTMGMVEGANEEEAVSNLLRYFPEALVNA